MASSGDIIKYRNASGVRILSTVCLLVAFMCILSLPQCDARPSPHYGGRGSSGGIQDLVLCEPKNGARSYQGSGRESIGSATSLTPC